MPFDIEAAVTERLNRFATQYRESPRLLFMSATYMRVLAQAYATINDLPEKLDLDIAVGDQLTLAGKRLGFPRTHLVSVIQPVYGFGPSAVEQPITDFGDENGVWADLLDTGVGRIRINDDDLYRRFLRVRARQVNREFSLASLEAAIMEMWGSTARVMEAGLDRVIVAPGRPLTASEIAVQQIYPRVMPVAIGIRPLFHLGPTKVFGFGEGWGGFGEALSEESAAFSEIASITDETGDEITDETGDPITTGELTRDGQWLYAVDLSQPI